jgi:hypothetical protein
MHCNFEKGNSTSAPFATTMTMDEESRQQQQQSQQSLLQALSLFRGGPDQPDQPGPPGIPGLQQRAKMSGETRRAFRLATIERALAILSDDVDDDVSVSASLPSVSSPY